MRRNSAVYVCGDTDCPNDADFEHRFYYGCVPRDFSDRTGRSRTHKQHRNDLTGRYEWDGGCDAARAPA